MVLKELELVGYGGIADSSHHGKLEDILLFPLMLQYCYAFLFLELQYWTNWGVLDYKEIRYLGLTDITSNMFKSNKVLPSYAFEFVVLLAFLFLHGYQGLNMEGQYLLDIKSRLKDDLRYLDNWKSGDVTPCAWTSVNCSSDYEPVVISLDLNSMNLSGALSPSIGGLVHLTYLDLSFNSFSGNIPAEIGMCSKLQVMYLNNNNFEGEIPPEFGNLTSLINCDICNNKFSGSLPDEIGNLSSLVELVAYTNNLTGPLPPSIGKLKNLAIFRAGQNMISDSIPVEISKCESMKVLGLAQNQLGGEIPKEIGMLEFLRELILWDNELSGFIPKELGNCTSLVTLALYQNNFVGGIPAQIGNLKNIERLYIYRNELNGTIPKEIGNLTRAKEIDFSENFLVGGIPAELRNIKDLRLLYLFQNQLAGIIPPELCELKNLTKLDLSINNLTGSIPVGLQYLPELLQLQLFDNSLSGVIPQELGVYSPLWVVDFSNNNLTGFFPSHLCKHSNLTMLNFWSNKFTGNIPGGITNCKSLVQLRLGDNRLTGSFPANLCKLANLSIIELDQNRFSGPIPIEIRNCKGLQRLSLSSNFFTSELPREIGDLSQLVFFNISSNRIGGGIPPEIVICKALQRLDLSQNRFVGMLPNELGTLQQLELLILSDNQLSGTIPSILGNLSHLTELQLGGNQFSGRIPKELGGLSSLQIAMNLSYNNLSGDIPPELGDLALLEYLLLNNNDLNGGIPSTFVNLSSLLGLNVSYNVLIGPIPSLALFQNMASSSFIGNKGLCGEPLTSCGGAPTPPLPDSGLPSNTLGKIVGITAASIGGIALLIIAVIVYYMRRPVETVTPFQDKQLSSAASDLYIYPNEGFTFQDLIAATNNFNEDFVIGRGACGTVYRAVMNNGLVVAVKKLSSNREGNNTDNSFHAEILTLGNIRHRNIVKLYGYCYHQGSNLLLYEYMSRGSLGEMIHRRSANLDWETRFMIAVGAAHGLSYLHHDCKPRIIHRDIKSNNILIDDNFEAHVGDFGLARVIDMPQSKLMSAVAGSYGYIAPEYAYTMKVTEKCDIYSYGVVLLELLTGRTPVQPLDHGGDLVTWVWNYIRDHSLNSGILDSHINLEDKNVVDHMIVVLKIALLCTNMSPFDRPSMRQVVLMLTESKERFGSCPSSPLSDHLLKEDIP